MYYTGKCLRLILYRFMGLGDPNLVEVSKLMDLLHTTLDYYEQITSKRDFLAQDVS
jgi:hypothetical protein